MLKKNFLIIIISLLFACSNSDKKFNENNLSDDNSEISTITEVIESNNENIPAERKLIWEGNLVLEVKNLKESTNHINELCNSSNAHISNVKLENENYQISNTTTIKVENEHFNTLINKLKGQSIYIQKLEITSNDVTEEYLDIESRLKTKKEVRERYIEVLRTKATSISEIIEAEEAIRVITEEIEVKEGRLRFLKENVDYSTINLLIFEKINYISRNNTFEKTYFEKAWESIKNGWGIITSLFLNILNVWPLFILISIFVLKRKWLKKKFNIKE